MRKNEVKNVTLKKTLNIIFKQEKNKPPNFYLTRILSKSRIRKKQGVRIVKNIQTQSLEEWISF